MRAGILCLIISTCLTRHVAAQPTATAVGAAENDLESILEGAKKKHKVPALAAAVVRGGRTIALGAIGKRAAGSKPRIMIDDRFHLGSCTKSMTATLCAMLVEQGKLKWDTTVAEAFGELAEGLHPKFADVTLEQLLCHRSGLADDHRPDLATWPKVLLLRGELPAQRRGLVELVLSRAPAHEPGSKFAYSNYGFAVAGAMCEAVTAEPYESLMRRMLFDPLDMKTAGFGAPGSAKKVDQPRGHRKMLAWYTSVAPGPGSDNPPAIAPAGTVHCSLPDWAKYAALHLDASRGKPRLLKVETFAKLHSDPYQQDYGFGWAIRKLEWSAEKVLAHDGSNTMWYAVIVIAPKEDIAILTATNAADEAAQTACADARKAIREKFLWGAGRTSGK